MTQAFGRANETPVADQVFTFVQQDVNKGDHVAIKTHVQALLDKGIPAKKGPHEGFMEVKA